MVEAMDSSKPKKTWERKLPKKPSKKKKLTRKKTCTVKAMSGPSSSGILDLTPSTSDLVEEMPSISGVVMPEEIIVGSGPPESPNAHGESISVEELSVSEERTVSPETNNVYISEGDVETILDAGPSAYRADFFETLPSPDPELRVPPEDASSQPLLQNVLSQPLSTASEAQASLSPSPPGFATPIQFRKGMGKLPTQIVVTAVNVEVHHSSSMPPPTTPQKGAIAPPSSSEGMDGLSEDDVISGFANVVERIAEPKHLTSAPSDQLTVIDIAAPSELQSCDADMPQLLQLVRVRVKSSIPSNWIVTEERDGTCVGLRAFHKTLVIQRSLFLGINGHVEITVHGKDLIESHPFRSEVSRVELTSETVEEFAQNVILMVDRFRRWEICRGVEDLQSSWSFVDGAEVDNNPFLEARYKQTCRSKMCTRLVSGLTVKRCSECQITWKALYYREKCAKNRPTATPPKRKGDKYLNTPEKKKRLMHQRKEIRRSHEEIARLRSKIDSLLEKDSVEVDEDLSQDIREILSDTEQTNKLSDFQRLFIEQQLKAASLKSASSMRWNPAIIRLALSLKMTSTAAYEVLRGVLRLPSERQLFDYSHAIDAKGNDLLNLFQDLDGECSLSEQEDLES